MPESLLETWHRARGRDRPGLRPHRGGAERPLPPARGREAQARLRRQAVSARRRRAPRCRDRRAPRRRGDRRARRPRPERLRGLLAQPRGDRRRVYRRLALTGDVAERDGEGFYRIAGRIKDMVISGARTSIRRRSRTSSHAHPAVLEAAVVGVPDERWGEACAAFVVLASGASASEDELREHLPRAARALQGAEDVRRSSTRCRGRRWGRC